jgi:hypothetical protein
MSVWAWILIGATTVLALSVLVSLAVGAILGGISREVSQLLEPGAWGLAPPMQAKAAAART